MDGERELSKFGRLNESDLPLIYWRNVGSGSDLVKKWLASSNSARWLQNRIGERSRSETSSEEVTHRRVKVDHLYTAPSPFLGAQSAVIALPANASGLQLRQRAPTHTRQDLPLRRAQRKFSYVIHWAQWAK